MSSHDVLIAGAGPAGAACAAFCAQAGLRVIVLEREHFPREKVCGDCLNPRCWPVLERMGVAATVRAMPHSNVRVLEIATLAGTLLHHALPQAHAGCEGREGAIIAIPRGRFDAALAARAVQLGAEIRHGCPVTRLERVAEGWRASTGGEEFFAKRIVAADGRNSTVARLLGLLPVASRDRVALQVHCPTPAGFGEKVLLRFLPEGYCGAATVGDGKINLCLVGSPQALPALRQRAVQLGLLEGFNSSNAAGAFEESAGADKPMWRTITPLARVPIPVSKLPPGVLLAGDAARVVEPFTGEGIGYALASGELAAHCLAGTINLARWHAAHRGLYSGRLWVNRLAKLAVLHPGSAGKILERTPGANWALRRLAAKVLGP